MQRRVDLGVSFWVWARFKLVNLHGDSNRSDVLLENPRGTMGQAGLFGPVLKLP